MFYATHKGWDRNTHKLTQLVDIGNWILWSKTEQAQRDPKNPPPPEWRPGDPIPDQKPAMTIGDYIELAGLSGYDDME